jgi:hypothetical protein
VKGVMEIRTGKTQPYTNEARKQLCATEPWDSLETEIRARHAASIKLLLLLSYTLKWSNTAFFKSSSVEIDVNCPVRVVSSELLKDFFL